MNSTPQPSNASSVACPWCQASPRQRCTTRTGRTLPKPHPSRTATARETA